MADKKPKPKKAPRKADPATVLGVLLALGGIVGGLVLEKGKIQDILQGTAAMIVFGGTLGAVLVTTPMPIFLRAVRALQGIVSAPTHSVSERVEALVNFATRARKNGIVSLETDALEVEDPFLRKALGLAVDGTDLQEMKKMMEIDISVSEHDDEAAAKVWEAAGGYAPTIGIIGAVMGLIQVMKHLEDIKEVGHGIAVAFVATVYGVGSANILFLPAAQKLRARMREAVMLKEMTLEGIVGIVEGLNPTLIRLKLSSFDQARSKPKKVKGTEKAPEASKAEPAAAGT
jgi:chemotaxis protein MotA